MSIVEGFIQIPAGRARLGVSKREQRLLATNANEVVEALEEVVVHVPAFEIQSHPVTIGEYLEFLRKRRRHAAIETVIAMNDSDVEDLPVTCLNFAEANEYAWEHGWRLPTEQEWEYAARGREGLRFPWGDADDPELVHDHLVPVLSNAKNTSPFGVHDMLGLVDEMTSTVVLRNGQPGYIAKGCPSSMKVRFSARRFVLRFKERWAVTGFRCARDVAFDVLSN